MISSVVRPEVVAVPGFAEVFIYMKMQRSGMSLRYSDRCELIN